LKNKKNTHRCVENPFEEPTDAVIEVKEWNHSAAKATGKVKRRQKIDL